MGPCMVLLPHTPSPLVYACSSDAHFPCSGIKPLTPGPQGCDLGTSSHQPSGAELRVPHNLGSSIPKTLCLEAARCSWAHRAWCSWPEKCGRSRSVRRVLQPQRWRPASRLLNPRPRGRHAAAGPAAPGAAGRRTAGAAGP